MSGETVTYSLEAVLTRIEGKLDTLQKDVSDLKVGLATLTEKVEGIDKRLEKVEGNQQKQIWSLITLIIGAVVVAGWRSFFGGNP